MTTLISVMREKHIKKVRPGDRLSEAFLKAVIAELKSEGRDSFPRQFRGGVHLGVEGGVCFKSQRWKEVRTVGEGGWRGVW